jgi:2,3-dihydroxyphenylpropionate 1,2-dioxygenase
MDFCLECLSHTPLHGYHDPAPDILEEVQRQFARARARVDSFAPDLIVLFGPDHYNGFFYEVMPPFCIGVEARAIGDFNSLAGDLVVPKDFALSCAQAALQSGIDVAVSYRMEVDHGFAQALDVLTGGIDRYPVLPVFINCVAPPLAPCRRARLLGKAIGHCAASSGKRVLFVGSGGISHEPPVPEIANASPEVASRLIAGRNPTEEARSARQDRTVAAAKSFTAGKSELHSLNPTWDMQFLDLLAAGDLDAIDQFSDESITAEGGKSAHEIRTWIAAFGALAANGPFRATIEYYRAIPEWIAGFAVMTGASCGGQSDAT